MDNDQKLDIGEVNELLEDILYDIKNDEFL